MSLSIKEACRYHNFLDSIISKLSFYLMNTDNAIIVKEEHIKSKSNSEAQDEVLDVTIEKQFNCTVVDIAFLVKQLIEEKMKLSNAITDAKNNLLIEYKIDGINVNHLDSAIIYAKKSRELANIIKNLVNLKSNETQKIGSDFKFNVEGNQVPYKYNIKVVKTIDYNREVVNNLYKSLLSKADELSTLIETLMLKESVSYTGIYDIHDSVDEIVDKYVLSRKEN